MQLLVSWGEVTMKANAHDEAFAMSSPLLIAKGLHTNVRATHECQTYAALLFKTLFPEGPRDSLLPAPELVKISLTLTVLLQITIQNPPKRSSPFPQKSTWPPFRSFSARFGRLTLLCVVIGSALGLFWAQRAFPAPFAPSCFHWRPQSHPPRGGPASHYPESSTPH